MKIDQLNKDNQRLSFTITEQNVTLAELVSFIRNKIEL